MLLTIVFQTLVRPINRNCPSKCCQMYLTMPHLDFVFRLRYLKILGIFVVRNVQLCVNHKDIFCKAFLSTSFFVNVSFFEKLFYHRAATNRQYIFFERVFKYRLIADVDFELKYSTIFIRQCNFTKKYSTGSIQTLGKC